jgi:hypothetical protein
MQFAEATFGSFRIYVGALEAAGGFTAALVVRRNEPGADTRPDLFRDDSLACGYCWPTADAALQYAMNRGRELVRRQVSDGQPA